MNIKLNLDDSVGAICGSFPEYNIVLTDQVAERSPEFLLTLYLMESEGQEKYKRS